MAHRIPLIVNATANQIQEVNETTDSLAGGVPLGAILMWGGGNTIPTGFTLCNAANAGTVNGIVVPNLEDKFIIGAKQHNSGWKTNITGSLGASGGTKDSVIVSHTHTTNSTSKTLTGSVGKISETYDTSGTASGVFTKGSSASAPNTPGGPDSSSCGSFDFDGTHTHGTNDPGVAGTNQNLPPYVALAYIIRTS